MPYPSSGSDHSIRIIKFVGLFFVLVLAAFYFWTALVIYAGFSWWTRNTWFFFPPPRWQNMSLLANNCSFKILYSLSLSPCSSESIRILYYYRHYVVFYELFTSYQLCLDTWIAAVLCYPFVVGSPIWDWLYLTRFFVSFSFWLFLVAVNYTKCNLDIVFIIFLKKVVEGLVIVWHLTLILIFEELNVIFGLFFRKLNLVKSVHSVDFKV